MPDTEGRVLSAEDEWAGWSTVSRVVCVVAPCCGFIFDAGHVDVATGRFSCPLCLSAPARTAS